MGMDGMAREGIPEEIEAQIEKVEREASKLTELFGKHGYEASESPIYVACDEVRDDLEADSEEEDPDNG